MIIRVMYTFYAFKCKLKELTTKSVFSAKGPCSFGMRMPSSSLHPRVIQWHGDFPSCCVIRATRFLSAIFVPLPVVLSPLIFFSDTGTCLFPFVWGSWLGCAVVPTMGALFNLGVGCQKWKPLDTPRTQPPFSDAVVNEKSSFFVSLSPHKDWSVAWRPKRTAA